MKTITVMIPAYNEEKNLEQAVNSVLKELENRFTKYEILIFNDKSSDKTPEIANKLALKNKNIKVIHNKKNMGMGYNYMEGVKRSSMQYFTFFPGDNENDGDYFGKTLDKIDTADVIIPYPINTEVRKWGRRITSTLFTALLNILFGLNLKYYNGLIVYKTDIIKNIPITTYGFAYSAESLTKVLKSGSTYIEIGIKIKPTNKSSIFRIKNIISTVKAIFYMFYDINIRNRKLYNKKPFKF